ncbi:MAG TPA: AAC(3) family N-acetyltransferase, partial [Magnetovibrio sp.]
ERSVFSWIEEHDAHLIMLGTSVMNCSFPHRVEWLLRSVIPYREPKAFEGTVQWRGQRHTCRETLLVRKLHPPILNTFEPLEKPLIESGLKSIALGSSQIAEIGAAKVIDVVMPLVRRTPDLLVKYLDDEKS